MRIGLGLNALIESTLWSFFHSRQSSL
ncbi:hypothetical protein VCHENC02_4892A, partial [Vibrio harveyi]